MTSDSLMRADAGVDDAHLDLGLLDLAQRVLERLDAALHVGLDDEVELEHLPSAMRAKRSSSVRARCLASASVLMRLARLLAERCAPRARSRRRGRARPPSGTPSKPRTSTGVDGPPRLERLARVVAHGAHAAAGRRRRRSRRRRAACRADEHAWPRRRGPGRARLDDGAAGRGVGVGLELGSTSATSRSMSRRLSRPMRFLALASTNIGVAAPVLGDELVLGELLLDPVEVGVGLVDLVDAR